MTLTLFDFTEAPITQDETTRLEELESTIEGGLKTFVDVGMALMEIRDSRLYRSEYQTFEAYLSDRWNISRRRAYQMIDAASVAENVNRGTQIILANERQARPLTVLPEDQQTQAWQRVIDTAPNGRITTEHVQGVVDEIRHEPRPHVANNSGNNEWYTPLEYIEAARGVMGAIDLDPASSEIANRTVRASAFMTAEDDGLSYSWSGRVWMNPPYSGDLIGKFTDKLVGHYLEGSVTEAIVLVNNATETGWFQSMLSQSSAVCFPRGRVKFIDTDGNPSGAPLQGQAVLYFGNKQELFADMYSRFGKVLHG